MIFKNTGLNNVYIFQYKNNKKSSEKQANGTALNAIETYELSCFIIIFL